jgi:hypothetical protein
MQSNALGCLYRNSETGQHVILDHKTRRLSPWVRPGEHPWRGLDP